MAQGNYSHKMADCKLLKIGYSPANVNDYADRMIANLSHAGSVIPLPFLNKNSWPLCKKFCTNRLDILILNFFENDICHPVTGKVYFKGLFKVAKTIIISKLIAKKIVFFKHNNYPHHCYHKHIKKTVFFLGMLEKLFDGILIHSMEQADKKKVYIPHPLFFSADRVYSAMDDSGIPSNYFVIFGRILPYKNIQNLIEKIDPQINVLIIGKSYSKQYTALLRSKACHKKITIIPEHLEKKQVAKFVQMSKGLVICNNEKDMIVSGSFFFAISLGIPVYALQTPFLTFLKQKLLFPGLFLYSGLDDLLTDLSVNKNEINKAARVAILNKANELFGDETINHKLKSYISLIKRKQ